MSKNKFYWWEGVTRKEVESALLAKKYPALYRQTTRRGLVLLYLLLLVAFIMFPFMPWTVKYAFELFLLAFLTLYILLQSSVRKIADAPNDLLDERLVKIRDHSYLWAYRFLMVAVMLYLILYTLLTEVWPMSLSVYRDFIDLIDLVCLFIFFGCALPNLVIAWTLPSEDLD